MKDALDKLIARRTKKNPRFPAMLARASKQRRKADDGLTEKTLTYLATQKDVWAERRNSGSKLIPKKGGGFYRIWLGEPGTPDVCGQIQTYSDRPDRGYKALIYFGIETKCKGGKLNPTQRRFHEKAAKWGMPCVTVETLDDVISFIEGLRQ